MYELQEFSHTKPVTAANLNAMEAEIGRDAERLADQGAALDAVPAQADIYAGQLKLSVESGGYIDLMYGNELLCAAPLRDSSGYIAPREMEVSPASMVLAVGETGNITATLTPEDTSLQLRFWSGNPETAAVTRHGAVTGAKLGRSEISVKCGSITKKVNVRVDEIQTPLRLDTGGAGGWDSAEQAAHLFSQYNTRVWTTPESGLRVPAGCKATVSLNGAAADGIMFNRVLILQDAAGKTARTDHGLSGLALDIVDAELVTDSDVIPYEISGAPYVYTNQSGSDVYLIISFIGPDDHFTQAQVDELMDEVTCRVEAL